MAAPIIAITPAAAETNYLNLTALTSEGGAWNQKQGTTGSDWILPNQYANAGVVGLPNNIKRKANGSEQIQFTQFSNAGVGSVIYMQQQDQPNGQLVYFDPNDMIGSSGSTTFNGAFRCVMIGSQNPSGFRITMPADQKLRNFRWYGYVNGAAPSAFSVTASLSDGYIAPVTVPLTKSSVFSDFAVAFRAVSPTAVLTVDITNTAGSGPGSEDYTFILFRAALLDAAVKPKPARGFKNLQQYLGSYGGANA